jgi:hypothetical protein
MELADCPEECPTVRSNISALKTRLFSTGSSRYSFVCWWFTAGFPSRASRACPVYLEILLYDMLYTGIGQFIAGKCSRRATVSLHSHITEPFNHAAYAPNAAVAHLVMPIILGTRVSFLACSFHTQPSSPSGAIGCTTVSRECEREGD